MTGSIQPKSGRLYMVIHYKDNNGKSKNEWIPTHLPIKGNMKTAKAMLEKWLHEHRNCDMNSASLLLSDYLESWINSVQFDLQPSTFRGYKGNLSNHIIPYFREKKIKLIDLKIRDLEMFYSNVLLIEKKLSPQSVLHCHRIISKALNDAIRQEIIPSNPASLAKCPKVNKHVPTFLNISQVKEIMRLFKNTPIEHVVNFICTYGLRRSEALGLCWDKVDFDNNQFTICRAKIQNTGGDYLKAGTKNDSSYRTLPLTSDMREMFLALKEEKEKNQRLFADSYLDSDSVFVFPDGTPIAPNYLSRTFHKTIMKSDLPKVTVHELRHSAASNLLAQGFSVVDIQMWLGHSQPSTTLNFYSHVDSSSKRNIQRFLDDNL